jgi:GMP synthase (glutamine-hydrolysing)
MTHMDFIDDIPEGFTITAHTGTFPLAVMENHAKKLYACPVPSRVAHTFRKRTSSRTSFWRSAVASRRILSDFARKQIESHQATVGDKKGLCALLGAWILLWPPS